MSSPGSGRVALLFIAVAVAAVCVRLGMWQLDRGQERRAFNDRVEAGLAEAPEALSGVLDAAERAPAAAEYRRVSATGEYDPAGEVILYGRSLDGRPGNHVLTPLVLSEGGAIVVDRGWIPFAPDQVVPVTASAAAPSGEVTVDGFLLPAGEPGAAEAGPVTTLQTIDLGVLQAQAPYRLVPLALQLESQRPAQGALPVPAGRPELSSGPHLSYAIQWFTFAAIAIVGGWALIRRDMRQPERARSGVGSEA